MVSSKPLVTVEKLGTQDCPRCNAADAQVIIERVKPKAPFWMMYVECGKCRGKFFVDFMHDEQKKIIDRRQELTKKYDNAKSPKERGRIFAEIRRLEKREEEWNHSL